MYRLTILGVALLLLAMSLGTVPARAGEFLGAPAAAAPAVPADLETDPMPHAGDAADDPAIWLHPEDPLRSTIIGTDKLGGIGVYDVAGHQLQYLPIGEINNIDLRYNFQLNGQRIDLVAAGNKTGGSHIVTYRVDPLTGLLEDVAARRIRVGFSAYGACMYRSPVSGKYYVFVNSSTGAVEQWELFATAAGKVDGRKVRAFNVGSQTEGCVADDMHAALYIAEEDVAIWRYGAEPGDGTARSKVDAVGAGRLKADIEGLAIYTAANGAGYLLASNQGDNSFAIYERTGSNAYVASFAVSAGNGVDRVSSTDGIDVANRPFGARFPNGVFVAHDGTNEGNTNFKLLGWDAIAGSATPRLLVDTTFDPRADQLPGPTPTTTATPSATATPPPATTTPPPATATATPTATSTATPSATPVQPTATPSPAPNRIFLPEADARVEEAFASTNYGSSTTLRADGSSDPDVESYLRFTVSNLSGTVQRATLRVFATTGTSNGPAVYNTVNTWSESAIKWNNRPARGMTPIDDRGTVQANSWVEYNVTFSVTGNGTYSFALATDTTNGINMLSRQGSSPPQLVITVQ